MPENEISDYLEVDANNVDIAGISVQENVMRPPAVNNAFRALQGALKRWFRTNLFQLRDGTDQTKLLAINISAFPTATTRTLDFASTGALELASGGSGSTSAIGAHDAFITKGTSIATAATLNLNSATGGFVDLTGTATVTAVTLDEGRQRSVRASSSFQITVGANLIGNGGRNVTVQAGDLILFEGYSGAVVRFWVTPFRGHAYDLIGKYDLAGASPFVQSALDPYTTVRISGYFRTTELASLSIRLSSNNGSSFRLASGDYDYQLQATAGGTSYNFASNTLSRFDPTGPNISSNTARGCSFDLTFQNLNGVHRTHLYGETTFIQDANSRVSVCDFSGESTVNGVDNAFQFASSSGNFLDGYIIVEGIRG